jgi:hypothetical protein
MLGFLTAKHVVELGRIAFFPGPEADLPLHRSPTLRGDDLTPQFGYVGEQYSSTRILLLGINPGNARDDIRSPEDSRMMPVLARFAQDPTERNFTDAGTAYKNECPNWRFWTHCAEVIRAGNLTFEEIAYSNCLPWRTASGSGFSREVARNAAERYVRPLIEELKPSLIVAMGKMKVAPILRMTGVTLPRLIIWNCARAPTSTVRQERADAVDEILRFLRHQRR